LNGETPAAGLSTLKIWQISCIAGALSVTSLATTHQFAGPNVATPNARVADAFSAMPPNVTVLANLSAAFPAPAAEAKADTRPSANEIVAAEFSDAAPQSVMPSDETSSPRQVRTLLANASLDAVPVNKEAMLRLDGPPAASPKPDQRELSYLKYYVYSEIPPPEKPAKIALAALRNVPLGTPVQRSNARPMHPVST